MIMLSVIIPGAFAQIEDYVVIGTGTKSTYQSPFNNYYKYSWNEHVYPKSSFSGPCTIYSVSYNCAAKKSTTLSELKIYMGVTTKSEIANTTDWTPERDLTLVYSGTNVVIGANTGWQEFTLNTPFLYDATKNLVVVVSKKLSTKNNTLKYYYTQVTSSMMYRQDNSSTAYSQHPGTNTGTKSSFRANIKIGVGPYIGGCEKPVDLAQSGASAHSVTISWKPAEDTETWDVYIGDIPTEQTVPTASAITDTTYTFAGLTPAQQYDCFVRTNCGESTSDWVAVSTMTDPDFSGMGTVENPYLIYTLDNINTIIYAMEHGWPTTSKHFRLMDDIGTLTRPIGSDILAFDGDFDGNGHFITVDLSGVQYVGLFAYITNGANIHDLNVDGNIVATSNFGGGIVAYATVTTANNEGIRISDCTNYAEISGLRYTGGIVGYATGINSDLSVIVEGCTNRGIINCNGNGNGGVVGYGMFTTIDGCSNRSDFSSRNRSGGICGESRNSVIMNCMNKSNINVLGSSINESQGGGIVGLCRNTNVKNCCVIGDINGTNEMGGIAGNILLASASEYCEISNVYVGGNITANEQYYGGIFGTMDAADQLNITIDNAFYLNGGCTKNWSATITNYSDVCTFAPSEIPTQFVLSQVVGGTTDMRTALNDWIDGNEEYTTWFEDIYNVNGNYPTLGETEAPGISVSPSNLNFYYRPIGARMFAEEITLTNTSDVAMTITNIDFGEGNIFFMVEDVESLPFTIEAGLSKKFKVTTNPEANVEEGEISSFIVIAFSQRGIKTIPLTAIAYQPTAPDVVELPTVVTDFPFNTTQSTLSIRKNYDLPGENASGPEGVYKMTFENDVLFSATVADCNNPKIVIYNEDLDGKAYPDVDNYYAYAEGEISQLTLPVGTYYLIAAATSSQYTLNANIETIPLPTEATAPYPYDGQTEIEGPVTFSFEKSLYATEYQILFGQTYPPTTVLQDWTNDFNAEVTANVNANSTYFWVVNQRNSSGMTEGSVWGFTTTFTKPGRMICDTHYIYEGQTASMHWAAPNLRSFRGYNVYNDGVRINDEMITDNEYTVDGLTYNMASGYTFTVTAVYDEGESQFSDSDFVRVTGDGSVTGQVFEIDSITSIANATVTLTGIDEIDNSQSYTLTTNANGTINGVVKAGHYTATATKDGYGIGTCHGTITVNYNQNSQFVVTIRESINPVGAVYAEVINENETEINWSWNSNDRSFQYFNIYRTGCYDDVDVELVATNVTTMTYTDTDFATIPAGSYKYGVSAYYQGNRESSVKWNDIKSDKDLYAKTCGRMSENNVENESFVIAPEITRGATAYATRLSIPYNSIPAYYISYDVETPAIITRITETNDLSCGEYGGDGYYYGYDTYSYFYKIDYLTGVVVSRIYAGCFFVDMAFDYTTGVMYGSYAGTLWTINLTTGEPTLVGETGYASMQMIACNSEGQLYGVNYSETPEDCYLNLIDKETAECTVVGNTGMACMYLQSGGFNQADDKLYWMGCDEEGGFFAEINTTTGHAIVYATKGAEQVAWFIPSEYNPETDESAIVWSNCVDKDMIVTVEVDVTTNNSETPEETVVTFVSVSEPGVVFEATLDETGVYVWNEFRKGQYKLSIVKPGFTSCAFNTDIEITDSQVIDCLLEESKPAVENLYISHTGWMSWDYPTPQAYIAGDEFYYDFEDGTISGFTTIDADGDGNNWMNSGDFSATIPGHDSQRCILSASYDNNYGPLYPNNFIITAQKYHIGSSSTLSWFVCAQDANYPSEHYALCVSTADYPAPADFITVFEETLSGKDGKSGNSDVRGTKSQSAWQQKTIDLSAYAGENVYIAFRHYNCTDMYMLDIDDIRLYNANRDEDNRFVVEGFNIYFNGQMVGETETNFYQLDVDGLVEGQRYTASVEAVYETGEGPQTPFIFTYRNCDNFEGVTTFNGNVDNNDVVLTWSGVHGNKGTRDGQWFYYDDGENIAALGLNAGGSFYWAIEIPAEDLANYPDYYLTKVSMFDYNEHNGVIMIYQGGEYAPEELIYEQVYISKGTKQWVEYKFNEPVMLDVSKNLWIVMHNTTGQYVASYGNYVGTWRSCMISTDGNDWADVTNYGIFCSWNLRAYIDYGSWEDEARGVALFRDEVCITPDFLDVHTTSYRDVAPEAGEHEYALRVVYGEPVYHYNWNSMSCPQTVNVTVIPTSVEENAIYGVTVYPNPTDGVININGEGVENIMIYNALGQKIYESEVRNDMVEIDMARFGAGIYMIKIYGKAGESTHKISVY